MKKRIAVFGLALVVLSIVTLVAARSQDRAADLAQYLPMAERRPDIVFSQDGRQLSIVESWELHDTNAQEVISILKGENPDWKWLETPVEVYRADIRVKGKPLATLRLGKQGKKMILQRTRDYSKLSYLGHWVASMGRQKVLREKVVKTPGTTSYSITESPFPSF